MSLVLHIPGLDGTDDTIGNSYVSNSISGYSSDNMPSIGTINDDSSPYGKGLAFNGSGNITFNYEPKLNKTTTLSITGWIKNNSSLDNSTTWQQVLRLITRNKDNGDAHFRLERTVNTTQFNWFNNGGATNSGGIGNFDITIGEWRFFALSIDTVTHKARLFVYNPHSNSIVYDNTSTLIGSDTDPIRDCYFLDNFSLIKPAAMTDAFMDIRIYNHILSDFEIKELLKRPILHYSFDIGGG